jgi:hypothetical protein
MIVIINETEKKMKMLLSLIYLLSASLIGVRADADPLPDCSYSVGAGEVGAELQPFAGAHYCYASTLLILEDVDSSHVRASLYDSPDCMKTDQLWKQVVVPKTMITFSFYSGSSLSFLCTYTGFDMRNGWTEILIVPDIYRP